MPFQEDGKFRTTPLIEFTERGSQRQGRHSGFLFLKKRERQFRNFGRSEKPVASLAALFQDDWADG